MGPIALLVLVAACGPRPVRVVSTPVTPAPAPAVTKPVATPDSPWPVPMRVMTWSAEGLVQIGTLPDAPPAQLPATPWYVEPTKPLDRAAFERVVVALRSERVPGLSLRGQTVASWLGELRELPELTVLVLDDTDVETLAFELPQLRRLYLARTFVGDASLAAITRNLEVIDLEDCAITDAGVIHILKLSELRRLNLAGTRITDTGGALLGGLGNLAVLDLGGTVVAAKTLAAIRPLALLELYLDHTRIGPGLHTLDGFAPGISRFDVSALQSYKPTDSDLAWLAKAPNLVEVGLSGSKVTDALVAQIGNRRKLRVVKLAGTAITRDSIDAVMMSKHLEEVDFADTPVSDVQAAELLAMPNMRAVRLDRTKIGDGALKLVEQPSGKLVELYLSYTKVTDAGLVILDQTPKLEGLGLADTQLGDLTVQRIAKLSELRTLVLSKARTGRAILGELGKLHELERLYLDDTRMGDEQVPALVQLTQLRVLHLESTDVSELALPTLRTFTQLDELTLGDTRLRSGSLDLSVWYRLRTLSLMGLDITDDDLKIIAKRRSLVTLDLSATEVRDLSPLLALPNLRVLGLARTKLTAQGTQAAQTLRARGVEIVQ